ncbi:MAG: type II secretion system GspH family protein [Oscillospiraceae bacterium]|jgi:prepilin-type N-terminal cleavage/methylation domain-containing protein|nr:type II secretion system GspH family protein [Oscillospiraceae bacterium]
MRVMRVMSVKNLKRKKGFSLIELLVSFAIFAVLCAALVGFISMSSRTYRRTTDMVNLQIEYQIVMNMLAEYIIDCDEEIEFDADTLTITNSHEAPHVFTLQDDGLFLGDAVVSRNVIAFSARREDANLLAVSMSFTPTNPHDPRTYTAEQLIALRNSPKVVIAGEEENHDDDDEE